MDQALPGSNHSLQTVLVHAGETPRVAGAAVAPIFQSATFLFEGQNSYDTVRYTRCNNNPTQLALASKIAAAEGTESALVLASGMAAISTTLLSLLSAGDHMLIQRSTYGGTHSLVHEDLPSWGISYSEVDAADPSSWPAHVVPGRTKVMYVETISNPLIQVPQLDAVPGFCQEHGIISIIDNTFASPAILRPAVLGYDLVVESCTKYMNGHSDVIAGCVAGSQALVDKVLHKANHLGCTLDPHAAFLLQRGLKTLVLRVRQQSQSALALARMLHAHPQVLRVNYPGLESHAMHEVALRLFNQGFGGMLSFELRGGVAAAEAFMQACKLGLVATSLGGVETLLTRPATTSHVGQSPEERAQMGISDGLIRVSVGIEDTQDLVDDFGAALRVAERAAGP
mmetsp:Transcript_25443/g.55247  ORF Transcript_25443/g.55247 Transcript_25443/m.55247 type:complete len:398 (+) Transcript_25443:147-1340(+)|eukprot:CAMPEP_0202891904 /NCGR_PEP_ID=MMETSP1392-20130828/1824_1 /ASSEMBLY_ACC=CAM_ASM_000868 /TAXON_ID=225041 /ORGANISM="Chlamydomonas chlamydogama, Strain SAG 11-48b" /LENGTH=397 /DNA_ID=CAMNT_0049575771 /DNA_START=147 /DNA_END=1340 /DNA_ORIENTATION=+